MKTFAYRPGKRALLMSRSLVLAGVFAVISPVVMAPLAAAQAAPAANRVLGTVKSIAGNTVVVAPDGGAAPQTVTVADGARIQQSADMKTVAPSSLDKLAVGDRVLATGTPGDGGALTATRVIMIKSEAIAQRNQNSQQDWARRGMGGLVNSVDASAKTLSIKVGQKDVAVTTTNQTIFRRYAPGSVKYDDAKSGKFDDIQKGDQLRVRGDKSPDGGAITADEIVSGTFKNIAGTIVSVDAASNTVVVKDLASKKNQTVTIGPNTDLRNMPPEIAARFAAAKAGGAGRGPGGAGPGAVGPGAGAPPAGAAATAAAGAPPAGGEGRRMGGGAPGEGGAGRGPGGGGFAGRGGGATSGDLSQVIPRLPKANVADLKAGEALMIVASGAGNAGPFTAITLLSGVEPLLTGPAGSELTIPAWSSSGAESGGGAAE